MSDLTDMAMAIDSVMEQTGWHEDGACEPTLFMAYTEGDGRIVPRRIPVPTELWEASPTVGWALEAFAQMYYRDSAVGLRASTRELKPVALFISTEAWRVTADRDGYEEVQELARRRQINSHPDRIECRMTLAQRIGSEERVLVGRDRGQDRAEVAPGLEGGVPQGLSALARAFQYSIEEGGPAVSDLIREALKRERNNDG